MVTNRIRGYTLVELLVVVAIVAILAAMIAPVLLQAKESARMRTCAENMRQLGQAITRYMDDNSGYGLPLPPPQYNNPWILCVEPLIPNYVIGSLKSLEGELPLPEDSTVPRVSNKTQPRRLWICPGDIYRGEIDTPFWWRLGSSYMYPGPTAYMSGGSEFPSGKERAKIVPRKPMMWRNHKRDMLLADYWVDFHSGQRAKHEFLQGSLTPPLWIKSKICGVLFLDQHMQAVTPADRTRYQKYTKVDDNPFYGK